MSNPRGVMAAGILLAFTVGCAQSVAPPKSTRQSPEKSAAPVASAARSSPQAEPSPAAPASRRVLRDFTKDGFDFSYLAWEGAPSMTAGGVTIGSGGVDDRGGAGVNGKLDLSAYGSGAIALTLSPGEANESETVNVLMSDGDGTEAIFEYPLAILPRGEPTSVVPVGGRTLSNPTRITKQGTCEGLDLASISQWQLQGPWQGRKIAFTISSAEVIPEVTDEMREVEARLTQIYSKRVATERQDRTRMTLLDLDDVGLTFAFEKWENKVKKSPDALVIRDTTDAGGGGIVKKLDLRGFEDGMLTVRLKKGPKHDSPLLTVVLQDEDGSEAHYRFATRDIQTNEFVTIDADGFAAISPKRLEKPGTVEGLDLGAIKLVMFIGAWQGKTMDLEIDELAAVRKVSDDLLQKRASAERAAEENAKRDAERQLMETETRDREKRSLLGSAPHEADGPNVIHLGTVAPNMLGITIQEKEYYRTKQFPYVKQDGDTIERSENEVLCVEDGEVVMVKKHVTVKRVDKDGQQQTLGALAVNSNMIKGADGATGKSLTVATIAEPAAYEITSDEDAAYAKPQHPTEVHWKRKPNAPSSMALRCWVYLELPHALKEGNRYTVAFKGINTRQASVEYVHDTTVVRSDAVHASHVGYREDDPFKRAFLSMWLGTGGAYTYADHERMKFHVVDAASGESVYEGRVKLIKRASDQENFLEGRNYSKTDTYVLDFGEFKGRGTYRVSVEGVGCSYPFAIGPQSWEEALRVSMLGFLQQRSGIELDEKLMGYARPRDMHPADGAKVFASKFSPYYGGTGQDQVFKELMKDENRTDRLLPEAWGGYHDAADWDRNSVHLLATYELLELYDLFPAYYSKLKLKLPAGEARNKIPDIIDEALWNLDLFHRLQEKDGGVRGGIESTCHPRPGECSWQESLMMSAFAPDPRSSFWFAACAAKTARLMRDSDRRLSPKYRAAAIKAWEWAERDIARTEDAKVKHGADAERALASVELYWLTSEKRFHDVYSDLAVVKKANPTWAELGTQRDSTFAYARLPDELADAGLKTAARAAVVRLADAANAFGEGNTFGLSMDDRLPPMGWVGYFTKPGATSRALPRAYYLTRDEKYLAGTIRATQFAIGANPENICLTSGLGPNPINWPMHIDSANSGQETPPGVTVYGISDPGMKYGFDGWAHQWLLNHEGKMIPNSYTWPANESYWDVYTVPSTNEYQPHVFAQSAYYWGFLAARDSL